MSRFVKQVPRGVIRRERRKFVVFSAEGKNETERKYLLSLNKCQSKFIFKYASGNATDPVGLVKDLIKKKQEVENIEGDMFVSLLDIDNSQTKIKQLEAAKSSAELNGIDIVISNPSFEFWFLEHYAISNSFYNNQKELINDLKKYIPNYQKSDDISQKLIPLTSYAIKNDDINKKNHKLYGHNTILSLNPYTEISSLIKKLNIN